MSIGCHVYKEGGSTPNSIQAAIKRAKDADIIMNAAQIFVIGPRNDKETLNNDDIASLRDDMPSDFKLFVHGSYFDNPWGKKASFGEHLIRRELEICAAINARGLVIHLPRGSSGADVAKEIEKIIVARDSTANDNMPALYLEISAGRGNFETPARLRELFDAIRDKGSLTDNKGSITDNKVSTLTARCGLCLDTAHAWAAGIDLRTWDDARRWLDDIMAIESLPRDEDGTPRILFHLNDQIYERGSGRDEHAPLMYGTIWGHFWKEGNPDESGLAYILDFVERNNLTAILERHDDRPKIDGKPKIANLLSDYQVISQLGYFT